MIGSFEAETVDSLDNFFRTEPFECDGAVVISKHVMK